MNNEKLKTYKVTLRSIVDVEVEVEAESPDEAYAKAYEWRNYDDGVTEFNEYYFGDNVELVEELFSMWWRMCDFDNDIIGVEEIEEEIEEEAGIRPEGSMGLDPDVTLGRLGDV